MKTTLARTASVALAAAVAFIVTAAAVADYPSVISSFRMSGKAPPYARGVYIPWYSRTIYAIFYEGPGRHSLRVFTTTGSLIATYTMPGGVVLGDADFPPAGYSGYLAVVDEGSHELKAYTTTGSFYRVIRTLPSDVVGYGVGGHVTAYLHLGTRGGVVYRYTPTWSFLNSFLTGMEIADLAAGQGYKGYWSDWLEVGGARYGEPVRVYRGGYFYGSFSLPGVRNCGASAGFRSAYFCLRDLGTEIWAYVVELGPLMAVEPASLGKVKALFK